MALLAATHPERVRSLIWIRPTPRASAAPDYPWGVGPDYIERDRIITGSWGTVEWARAFIDLNNNVMEGFWSTRSYMEFLARLSRRTCSPDVAEQLNTIWYETDIRSVLPTVQVPTLLVLDQDDGDLQLAGMAGHVAELMPHAEVEPYVSVTEDLVGVGIGLEQIRRFIGVERRPDDLDSVLATVMFTDIVDSTKRSAELGDHDWRCGASPARRDRAHRVGASPRARDQDLGRRVPRHVRGAGEGRALRSRDRRRRSQPRHRDPRRTAHRRGGTRGRRHRRHRRRDRGPGGRPGGPLRGAGVPNREGPDRRERPRVRRRG